MKNQKFKKNPTQPKIDSSYPIFCLNGGSSSLKFAFFKGETSFMRGAVEGIGLSSGTMWIKKEGEKTLEKTASFSDRKEALSSFFQWINAISQMPIPKAIGHRIVYGGKAGETHRLIDRDLLSQMKKDAFEAPLHLPQEIALIEAIRDRFPKAKQVACFDSAFYSSLPLLAQRLPLSVTLSQGMRRRGFHGLSYESVLAQLENTAGKWIFAHLGSGASLTAVKEKKAIETTMGFSPTGGIMMGTRSGDLDPGVFFYLMRKEGYTLEKLEQLLEHESGLLGVSQLSSDMKKLLESSTKYPKAEEAISLFCYYIIKAIGSFFPILGGLDGIVFTGGIGAFSPEIRSRICSSLHLLRAIIDEKKNKQNAPIISTASSFVRIHVIPADEEWMIARHTYRLAFEGSLT